MSIETSVFAVQRGDQQFSCKGSDFSDKVNPTDLLTVQREGVTYKVTGAQFTELGTPPTPSIPWDDLDVIYHVIVADPADINVEGTFTIYNKDTLEEVASINAPGEWIIGHESGIEIRFHGASGTWEFGELTDVSKSTNMMGLFENSRNFNGDISGFDTGNVTDMTAMFTNCSAFNQDISGWDTHSLQVAMTTFMNASNFNQDLSGWCVPLMSSPYSHMGFMDGTGSSAKEPVWGTCPRGEAKAVENFDLTLPTLSSDQVQDTDLLACTDTNGVTYKVTGAQLKSLFKPSSAPWDDADAIYHVIVDASNDIKVEYHDKIYNLANQTEVSSINAAGEWIITGLEACFPNSPGKWTFGDLTDTSNVTDMSRMFYSAKKFNADISNWNTSNVTDMYQMFAEAKKFNKNIGKWDVGNVKNMVYMFQNCKLFTTDISDWDVSNVTNMKYMFNMCVVFNSDISNWNPASVKDMQSMFKGAAAFNQDIGGWDVGNVTCMRSMFCNATAFNQDLTGWCVTDCRDDLLFIDGSGMPEDKSHNPKWGTCPQPEPWDGSQGIYHVIVDKPGDIRPSGYTKIYNLETKTEVSSINAAGEWIITGNKTCFKESSGNWNFGDLTDTSNVTNMYQMFEWTMSFNADISNWDVSNVTNMTSMFYYAFSFNQDLSGWCVSKLENGKYDTDFKTSSSLPPDGSYDPKWGTCP